MYQYKFLDAMACIHRRKRLLIDLVGAPAYQVMCARCLILTDYWPTGMRAYQAWLHDRRQELEALRLYVL